MKILIILNIFFLLVSNVNATEDKNKIAILVNDNVITNYDIEQRIKMFAILNQINITPENSNSITNNIVNELIDNLLKIEKINEYNISVKNSDIERLESAVINLTEGASDDKRMAIWSLESMIAEKKAVVEEFETQMEEEAEMFEMQKAAESGTKLF